MFRIWKSSGRISPKVYNWELSRHILYCLPAVGLYLLPFIDGIPPSITTSAATLATAAFTVLQYRFLQIQIRRLHDTNHSGKWLVLNPLYMIQMLGGGLFFYLILSHNAWSVPDISISPLERYIIGTIMILFALQKWVAHTYLNGPGTPGPNRFGPAPQA